MQTGKLFMMASCLTVLGLLMASCAPAAPAPAAKVETAVAKPTTTASAPTPTPKVAAEQPRYGGVLTLPTTSDPPDLDIHGQNTITLFALIANVYNGLLQYDEKDKVVSDLAERWEVSADGKVYTFHLRKGVKWHDGQPCTATDAKVSFERINNFAGLKFITESVDRIEATDENTLKMSLKYAQAGFLPGVGHGRALVGPKHIIDAKGNLKREGVGTGPFKLNDYQVGVSLAVVRNDAYFVKGFPYLDGITYYIMKDAATRFAAFRAGRVKIYGHPPTQGELGPFHRDLIGKQMAQAIVRPYAAEMAHGLMPNTTKAPWSDVRVRRAAFLAVDRQKAIDVAMDGVGEMGVSMLPGEWALPKEEMMKMPGFRQPKDQDILEAKRLLAEAGYPNGFASSVVVRVAVPIYEKGATFMKDQLAKIGIDLKLEMLEFAVMADRRAKLAFDSMEVMSALAFPDPDVAGRVISLKLGGVFSTLDDAETIELFTKQSQALDPQERKKLVWQLQYRIAESVPHIMLGWANSFVASWPEVKNYTTSGGTFMHNKLEHIWLAR